MHMPCTPHSLSEMNESEKQLQRTQKTNQIPAISRLFTRTVDETAAKYDRYWD